MSQQQLFDRQVHAPALPQDRFDLIYCDPPWRYDFSKSDSRKIENQYPTMSMEELYALKIPAAKNCVLYMWATAPKLVEAINLIAAWGFTYKSHAIWDKQIIGMGYWFRSQHELLMVATKGKISPPQPSERISSIFSFRRGKHSKKPWTIYEHIEAWYPELSKLEMFARNTRTGWKSWGNQV